MSKPKKHAHIQSVVELRTILKRHPRLWKKIINAERKKLGSHAFVGQRSSLRGTADKEWRQKQKSKLLGRERGSDHYPCTTVSKRRPQRPIHEDWTRKVFIIHLRFIPLTNAIVEYNTSFSTALFSRVYRRFFFSTEIFSVAWESFRNSGAHFCALYAHY